MSVRIHVISKQTGVPSKELIAILKKRGYQVSTASSSIDPISAEALVEELGPAEKTALGRTAGRRNKTGKTNPETANSSDTARPAPFERLRPVQGRN